MSRPRKTYQHPGSPLHGGLLLRRETGLIEAVCRHSIGHPIPESVEHMDKVGPKSARGSWGAHGCDGCCLGRNETINAHD